MSITILEIKDAEYPADESTLRHREAARAVLFDEQNLIPLLYVSKHDFHKLPGGGVDDGESLAEGLAREVKEETGCECKTVGELGQVIEYRSQFNLKQISHCYIGKVTAKGEPNFMQDEIDDGFQLVWLTLDEAIENIEKEKPRDYEGGFIQKRDLAFLKAAKEFVSKNI